MMEAPRYCIPDFLMYWIMKAPWYCLSDFLILYNVSCVCVHSRVIRILIQFMEIKIKRKFQIKRTHSRNNNYYIWILIYYGYMSATRRSFFQLVLSQLFHWWSGLWEGIPGRLMSTCIPLSLTLITLRDCVGRWMVTKTTISHTATDH